MKFVSLCAAFLLFYSSAIGCDLSDQERSLAIALTTLHAADWWQTSQIRKHELREANPILGENPTQSKVNRFMILSAIAAGAVICLSSKSNRKNGLIILMGVKGAVIAWNWNLGLRP